MVYLVESSHEINKDKLFRRLKIRENTSAFKVAENTYERLLKIIKNNMVLTNIYMIDEKLIKFNVDELDLCEKHIYCYSSGGQEIVKIIEGLIDKREYLDAYMLNDMSNDILFNASISMNEQIQEKIKNMGFHIGKNFFPGEHGFEMKHQKSILEILKKNVDINAELTESYMIIPEKSMLYVFGAGSVIKECTIEHDCGFCEKEECMYREI